MMCDVDDYGCSCKMNTSGRLCVDCEWVTDNDMEFTCPSCDNYTPDGSWCETCLDDVDLDEHEERKRKWLEEEQEY